MHELIAVGTRDAVSVVGAGLVVDVAAAEAAELPVALPVEPPLPGELPGELPVALPTEFPVEVMPGPELSLVDGPVIALPDELPELSWQERALCAQTDPEAFFPEKGGSTREAKRVCMSCEVRAECLEYALANDERFGIWGGLSERERRRVKKRAV